jgi:hypothetical protein
MLVYTKADRPSNSASDLTPPSSIRDIIEKSNNIVKEELARLELERSVKRERLEEMRKRCEDLTAVISPAEEEESFHWIPSAFLRSFYAGDEALNAIDMNLISCSHGKADPRKIKEMKCISNVPQTLSFLNRTAFMPLLCLYYVSLFCPVFPN